VDNERYGRGVVEVNMKKINPLVDPKLRMSTANVASIARTA
jgi:hypothetical protein